MARIAFADMEGADYAPRTPPHITITGDRSVANKWLPVARSMLWRLSLMEASGGEIQQDARDFQGGSIRVLRIGDTSRIEITAEAGAEVPPPSGLLYNRIPPKLLSGLIRGNTLDSAGLHDIKLTSNCATYVLGDPSLAGHWGVSKQLGTEQPVRVGPLITPGLYSGKMRKLVQVLLGMGDAGGASTITDLATGAVERVNDPRSLVHFDYRWHRTHGLHTELDGTVWVVEIARYFGVRAMRLPLLPDKIPPTEALRHVYRECLDLFGGIPAGTKLAMDEWSEAPGVVTLIYPSGLDEVYDSSDHGSVDTMGWSFNERGTEAHLVSFKTEGTRRWSHHYKVSISSGATLTAQLHRVSREEMFVSRPFIGPSRPNRAFVWEGSRFIPMSMAGSWYTITGGDPAPAPVTIFVSHQDGRLRVVKLGYNRGELNLSNPYYFITEGFTPGDTNGTPGGIQQKPSVPYNIVYYWSQGQTHYWGEKHGYPHSGWYEFSEVLPVADSGSYASVGETSGGWSSTGAFAGATYFWVPEGDREAFIIMEKKKTTYSIDVTENVECDEALGTFPHVAGNPFMFNPEAEALSQSPSIAEAEAEFHSLSESSFHIEMVPSLHISNTGDNYWYLAPVKVYDSFTVRYDEVWWGGGGNFWSVAPRQTRETDVSINYGEWSVFAPGVSIATPSKHTGPYSDVTVAMITPGGTGGPAGAYTDPNYERGLIESLTNTGARFRLQASALGPPHYTMSGLDFTYAAATKVGYMLSGEPEGTDLVYNFAGVVE